MILLNEHRFMANGVRPTRGNNKTSKSKFYLFESELPFYFLNGGVNLFLYGAFLPRFILLHERKVVDKYKGYEGFKTSITILAIVGS